MKSPGLSARAHGVHWGNSPRLRRVLPRHNTLEAAHHARLQPLADDADGYDNGSVTGTARAVRRVMVVFIFMHPSVSGNSLAVAMVDAEPS